MLRDFWNTAIGRRVANKMILQWRENATLSNPCNKTAQWSSRMHGTRVTIGPFARRVRSDRSCCILYQRARRRSATQARRTLNSSRHEVTIYTVSELAVLR